MPTTSLNIAILRHRKAFLCTYFKTTRSVQKYLNGFSLHLLSVFVVCCLHLFVVCLMSAFVVSVCCLLSVFVRLMSAFVVVYFCLCLLFVCCLHFAVCCCQCLLLYVACAYMCRFLLTAVLKLPYPFLICHYIHLFTLESTFPQQLKNKK